MKILIIGARGFIGSHLIKFFKKNNISYYGLVKDSNIGKNKTEKYFQFNEKNILRFIPEITHIINCAGTSTVKSNKLLNKKHKKYNEVITRLLVNILKKNKIKNKIIIHLSSQAVYDINSNNPKNENTKLKPFNYYGKTKLVSEKLLEQSQDNQIIILRLFSIYGNENKKQLIWDACQKFLKDKLFFQGSGYEVRDFLHIDDLIRLFKIIVKSKIKKKLNIYNVGFGVGTEILEVVEQIKRNFKIFKPLKFKKRFNPNNVRDVFVSNNSKIYKDYGWKPRVSLKKGLKSYVQWFKKKAKFL